MYKKDRVTGSYFKQILLFFFVSGLTPPSFAQPLLYADALAKKVLEIEGEEIPMPLRNAAQRIKEIAIKRPHEREVVRDFYRFHPETHHALMAFSTLYRSYRYQAEACTALPVHFYYAQDPRLTPTYTDAEKACPFRGFGGQFYSSCIHYSGGVLPTVVRAPFLYCPIPDGVYMSSSGTFQPLTSAYSLTSDFYYNVDITPSQLRFFYEAWQDLFVETRTLLREEVKQPQHFTTLKNHAAFIKKHERITGRIPPKDLKKSYEDQVLKGLTREENNFLAGYSDKLLAFFAKYLPLYVELFGHAPARILATIRICKILGRKTLADQIDTVAMSLHLNVWSIQIFTLDGYLWRIAPPLPQRELQFKSNPGTATEVPIIDDCHALKMDAAKETTEDRSSPSLIEVEAACAPLEPRTFLRTTESDPLATPTHKRRGPSQHHVQKRRRVDSTHTSDISNPRRALVAGHKLADAYYSQHSHEILEIMRAIQAHHASPPLFKK